MVLIFVATLEQVRVGIRGAQAEFFESMYGIWYYPCNSGEVNTSDSHPHSHTRWIPVGRITHPQPDCRFYYPFSVDWKKMGIQLIHLASSCF